MSVQCHQNPTSQSSWNYILKKLRQTNVAVNQTAAGLHRRPTQRIKSDRRLLNCISADLTGRGVLITGPTAAADRAD
jgi:hypothetical protein